MIIENINDKLTKLTAEQNKKIVNKDRTIVCDFIYIGKNDSVDNYQEVGYEIWKHFVEEEDDPTIEELKNRLADAQEQIDNLVNGLTTQEECLLDTDYRLLNLELMLDVIR